jgi:hypothetical protein
MLLGPDPYAAESFSKTQPKLGQLILHSWRDNWKNGAHYKPVRLHLAKRLGQHFLAHATDQFTQARKTQPAVLAEHFKGKHRPIIGNTANDLADQHLQLGVILLRRLRVRPMVGSDTGVSHDDTLL